MQICFLTERLQASAINGEHGSVMEALRPAVLQKGAGPTGEAAEQFLTKAMSGNVIAATVTIVVLSAADIVRGFSGHISKAQLCENVAEDDAVQMMRQLEQVFIEEVQERLLGQAESDQVMRNLQSEWDLREQMREMFASVSPEQYARWPIRPLVEAVLAGRKKVPAERQGAPQGRRPLLEDAAH